MPAIRHPGSPQRPPALWVPALLALLPALAAAAPQSDTFTEAVDVQLVLVDALVTDKAGRPVSDLTRDEFELLLDGEPVEISHFSPPRALTVEPQGRRGTAGARNAERQRFVIFIDQLHLSPLSRLIAFDQLLRTFDTLPREAEVMLVSFDGAVKVEVPFSTQRKPLRAALGRIAKANAVNLRAGFEERRLLQLLPQLLQTQAEQMLGFVPPDEVLELVCRGDLAPLVRTHAEQTRTLVEQTVAALQEFVSSLGAYDGRKVLLHVSDGVPLVAGQQAFDYAIELCNGSLAGQVTVESAPLVRELPPARQFPSEARLEMLSFNTADSWSRLAAEANTYRVTMYTLQASGLAPPSSASVDGAQMSASTESIGRLNDQDTLFALADETGGRTIFNTNDFRPDLERMLADGSLRYELAFAPSAPADGRRRAIRVKVTRPGLRVQHRKSFVAKTAHERSADTLMATLYHGRVDNRHALRMSAAGTKVVRGKNAEVLVRLEIPLDKMTLLARDESLHGQATLYFAVRDERGYHSGVGRKDLALVVDPADLGENYVYELSMWLTPGHEYEIAAALRDELAGEGSFVVTRVELPGKKKG